MKPTIRPFTHDGTVRSRLFWWGALPALNLIVLAMIHEDWSSSSHSLPTDVVALVLINLFLPPLAYGDRLNPKVAFDWSKRRLCVPRLKGLMTYTTSLKQDAETLPFDDISVIVRRPYGIQRKNREQPMTLVQVGRTSEPALESGGLVGIFHGWEAEPRGDEKELLDLLWRASPKASVKTLGKN